MSTAGASPETVVPFFSKMSIEPHVKPYCVIQAVVADPSHRTNLENYAYFLSQALNNQHEALYYYQVLNGCSGFVAHCEIKTKAAALFSKMLVANNVLIPLSFPTDRCLSVSTRSIITTLICIQTLPIQCVSSMKMV